MRNTESHPEYDIQIFFNNHNVLYQCFESLGWTWLL